MTTKENIIATLQSHKSQLLQLGVRDIVLLALRDEQWANSDIDLLIDFEPEKENFDNYMAAYDLFETLFKDERIELITKNGLSNYIGSRILKDILYV